MDSTKIRLKGIIKILISVLLLLGGIYYKTGESVDLVEIKDLPQDIKSSIEKTGVPYFNKDLGTFVIPAAENLKNKNFKYPKRLLGKIATLDDFFMKFGYTPGTREEEGTYSAVREKWNKFKDNIGSLVENISGGYSPTDSNWEIISESGAGITNLASNDLDIIYFDERDNNLHLGALEGKDAVSFFEQLGYFDQLAKQKELNRRTAGEGVITVAIFLYVLGLLILIWRFKRRKKKNKVNLQQEIKNTTVENNKNQINQISDVRLCPTCLTKNKSDSIFCEKCGDRIWI